MTTDQELEEIKLAKNTGKEALNQLVSKIKGRGISKEQEDKWTEALKTEPDLVCPCMVTMLILCCMTYALLTKREVKMAGYWPSSFLRFYGPRRSRGP